jgi:hypothetical protein
MCGVYTHMYVYSRQWLRDGRQNGLTDWLIMMGWDYVSELRPPTGLLFIPRVICEHGKQWWWWCRLGITPDSSTRALAVLPPETSGISRRNGRRSDNFAYQYLKYLNGSLTCRKVLRHGTSGFTSHPKEGVLRIFIALKNPSTWQGGGRITRFRFSTEAGVFVAIICSLLSGGPFPLVKVTVSWHHSPPSGEEVKNAWSYTFTSPYATASWHVA